MGKMATLCKILTVIDVKLFLSVMPWLPKVRHEMIHIHLLLDSIWDKISSQIPCQDLVKIPNHPHKFSSKTNPASLKSAKKISYIIYDYFIVISHFIIMNFEAWEDTEFKWIV
jgi:hypothetical protein